MLKEKTKNRLFLVGMILPIALIILLITASVLSPPIEPNQGLESERIILPAIRGKQVNLVDENLYDINKSPFFIEGEVLMRDVNDIYLNLHIKRFGRLTYFGIYLNDYYIEEDIENTEYVMLKIDKADVKKGANKIKVVIKDSSGGTSYPSFGKYPLRIYSDSKIVSEGLDSANFWVVD